MTEQTTAAQLADIQQVVLAALGAFENAQQLIDFSHVGAAQRALGASIGDTLDNAAAALDEHADAASNNSPSDTLRQALVHLRNALAAFVRHANWPDFGAAFLSSREQFCKALEGLYEGRDELPVIEAYFRFDDVAPDDPLLAHSADPNGPPVGVVQHLASSAHNQYSLYVPESYSANHAWPLIVALHGGYGRGDEYLWSWLRPARSRGYVILSPKSSGPTWSILQPTMDSASILAMLDEVCERYVIDKARVFLTGLSDGATFSYLLGLQHAERFAALAPIAGVLSPMTDQLLRSGTGKTLPMHVIHGARDMIFPVQSVRSTNQLFKSLGYDLTYTELPDWGHALTYAINEAIVLPWFEKAHDAGN
jgi:phospholipase/carboxylesterase